MSYNINDLLLRLDEEAERRDRVRMYVEEGTKERNHKYYEAHRKERLEQYHADKKQLHYYYENKEEILAKYDPEKAKEYNHDYYEEHRAEILEKKSKKWECECGCKVSLSSKSGHLKTPRHLKLMKAKEAERGRTDEPNGF